MNKEKRFLKLEQKCIDAQRMIELLTKRYKETELDSETYRILKNHHFSILERNKKAIAKLNQQQEQSA